MSKPTGKGRRKKRNVKPICDFPELTEEHLKNDCSEGTEENLSTSVYSISKSESLGRYLVSSKNIKIGETIIENEEPLVMGPVQQSEPLCLGCYVSLDDVNKFRCTKCNWPLCQSSCTGLHREQGHTIEECVMLTSILFDTSSMEKKRNIYNLIVPLRCLLLKQISKPKWKILMEMESHNEIRRKIKSIWQLNEQTVVTKLEKYFNKEEIHTVCGILEVNCFEVARTNISLRAIFPIAYLMSHNCIPNTIHTNDDDFKLKVRASTIIPKGQQITISYAYTLQGTAKRRAHIKESKFFDCTCERCSDSTELGTNLSTVVCPNCNHPSLVSSSPLVRDSSWICYYRKCIRNSVPQSYVNNLVEKFENDLKQLPENDIASYEDWIKRALICLHENHHLISEVKYTLILLYGKVPGFMIQDMSEDLLKRKISICEELLKIADIVEPGMSRLRGIILYELHAPIMMLITQKNAKHISSRTQLRYSLKRVVSYLQEASDILKFESKNTMEGKIAQAAQEALFATSDWKRTLGTFTRPSAVRAGGGEKESLERLVESFGNDYYLSMRTMLSRWGCNGVIAFLLITRKWCQIERSEYHH